MTARRVKMARMFMMALVLVMTLTMGSLCLASGHKSGCDDPLCSICQLLEQGLMPMVAASVAAMAELVMANLRCPAHEARPQCVSLVCRRIRMDD